MNSKISFYSTDWCGDCFRSKALLKKHNVSFTEINVDKDLEANEFIKVLQNQQRRIPTIVFEDGSFLVEPSDPELEQKLKNASVDFLIKPRVRFKGLAGEQATMFVRDFSGNALEFKAFKDPSMLFEKTLNN